MTDISDLFKSGKELTERELRGIACQSVEGVGSYVLIVGDIHYAYIISQISPPKYKPLFAYNRKELKLIE